MPLEIELLVTGDEITRGAVVDSNSAWLAEHVRARGAAVQRITSVGDAAAAIQAAIREAAGRCDVLVVSGGLGPTSDDLTAVAAASAAGAPLVCDDATLARIRERWARRARPMPPAVEKQALIPRGARVLANDEGTAPGFQLRIGRAECFFFAGVPVEMKHLAARHLFPWLEARADSVLVTRTLRFVGVPESEIDGALLEVARSAGVTFGLRAVFPETWASFSTGARSRTEAEALLAPVVLEALKRVGTSCYTTDDLPLAKVVGDLCVKVGWTVAVAESCTGGMLGEEITSIDGSSRYFLGGAVTYANAEKTRALGVAPELLQQHGAVSEPVVRAMAEGARGRFGATATLAITGIAGPGGGTPEKPVGTVWIALATPNGTTAALRRFTRTDRESIRRGSVAQALELLRRSLIEVPG